MMINRKLKLAVMLGALALLFTACGRGDYYYSGANQMYGSCDINATGENIFVGESTNADANDYYVFGEPITSVKLSLTVYPSGTGRATLSGALRVNGVVYCCTSQGGQVQLDDASSYAGMSEHAKYILYYAPLTCTPSSGGYYGSGQVTLRVGVSIPPVEYALLTPSNRIWGWIQASSGGVTGNNSNVEKFLQ